MQYDYDEFKEKLLKMGFTVEQIKEAEELDGSLGLSDLAYTHNSVDYCDYLENGIFYLSLKE